MTIAEIEASTGRMIDGDRLLKWFRDLSERGRIITVPDMRFIVSVLAKSVWISVKDRMPELAVADGYDNDGTPYDFQISKYVLAYESGEMSIAMLEDDGKGPFWVTEGGSEIEVTHWMPLPEPPEEEEEGTE